MATKDAPALGAGDSKGSWDVVEEAELVMPADLGDQFEEELPDDFELDAGELDAEAKALLDVAFAGLS